MQRLVVLVLVGLFAQLVDGALGMGYGATSTTLLLSAGFAPAAASASIHLAEVGTTLLSAAAHTSFGNVSWPTVRRLALPGALGAFLGAILLSRLSTEAARPWMAGLLGAIGVFVLVRFALRPIAAPDEHASPPGRRTGTTLGLFAGFLDATGGGGWGPIATPTLLLSGRLPARLVIGSVDTCEFLVAFAASAGFLLSLGSEVVAAPVILALLAGGLVAAPLAAWLVRKDPVTPPRRRSRRAPHPHKRPPPTGLAPSVSTEPLGGRASRHSHLALTV